MKTVHSFDYATGFYLGPVTLVDGDRSPLEPDVFLVPGNCVELEPPAAGDGQAIRWNGDAWVLFDLPKTAEELSPQPKTVEQLNDEIRVMRAAAYRDEADPLFFKYQRGEATREAWLGAIADIKARYPKSE